MLYEPTKHETLNNKMWSKDEVIDVIESIYQDTLNKFDDDKYWIADVNEDSYIESNKTVYNGAAGTIYALDKISQYLNKELPFDKKSTLYKIHKDYLNDPDTKEVVPSLFLGEVGILLVKYKFAPSKDLEDKIFKLVQDNIENETLEALWGGPGTMVAASFLYGITKEQRWASLFLENVKFLILKLKHEEEKGQPLWEQNIYGKRRRYVGAGHGYFGNMFGILKNLELLDNKDRDYVINHIKKALKLFSRESNGMMNFIPLYPENPDVKQFTQWCHGAPGVVNSLKNFPKDEYVDDCLMKCGELVWNAGPLIKGIALCHGNDGNGYTFLQLYKRTGDQKWLERARSFAMHAIDRRNGRCTLYTGEPGLALFLIDCIEENDDFPFLDNL